MKTKRLFNLSFGLILALALVLGVAWLTRQAAAQTSSPGAPATSQAALGSAFTYQGRLAQNDQAVSGTCDFVFRLYDGNLHQMGANLNKPNVPVRDGFFSVDLDFGADVFSGGERALNIDVSCPAGSGVYTHLGPDVQLRPAPYALGLRPGAIISDNIPNGTTLQLTNPSATGYALTADGRVFVNGPLHSDGDFSAASNAEIDGDLTVHSSLAVEGNAHVTGNLTWYTRTSYISLAASAFHPSQNTYSYTNDGGFLIPLDDQSTLYSAPVQLPHGATVTGFTWRWLDTSAPDSGSATLYQSSSGSWSAMAYLTTAGSAGWGSSDTTTVDLAKIDNSQFSYFVQLYLPNSNIGTSMLIIEYALTEPY